MREKPKTEYFAIKTWPGDADRLRELHGQLKAQYPDHEVRMADVFRICVGSGTTVIASGQAWPPPPDHRDDG